MTPETLVGLLAEPARMRVFASIVLGATSPTQITGSTDLTHRAVAGALRRLEAGGLISLVEGAWVAHVDSFAAAIRTRSQASRESGNDIEPDRSRAAVLRAFLTADGRLTSVPAGWAKRRVVLEHIVACFEPGVRYPEREVDAILRAWHDDHAALRRYLVDEELMAREDGVYWRIGGPISVGE